MIIAVDFDGTLAEHRYPEIGKPNKPLFELIIKLQKEGAKIILWTCREGDGLLRAVEFCKTQGLTFDAVNDNYAPCPGFAVDKILADIYVDDRGRTPWDFLDDYEGILGGVTNEVRETLRESDNEYY